jgi:hypothetical protein
LSTGIAPGPVTPAIDTDVVVLVVLREIQTMRAAGSYAANVRLAVAVVVGRHRRHAAGADHTDHRALVGLDRLPRVLGRPAADEDGTSRRIVGLVRTSLSPDRLAAVGRTSASY